MESVDSDKTDVVTNNSHHPGYPPYGRALVSSSVNEVVGVEELIRKRSSSTGKDILVASFW